MFWWGMAAGAALVAIAGFIWFVWYLSKMMDGF